MASARCRFSFAQSKSCRSTLLATGLRVAVRAHLVGVAGHLEHREVDERRHVLEVRVGDRLLEGADGRVSVAVGLELVERELGAGEVELRVVGDRLLELRLGVLVVTAALVGQARVVGRLGELAVLVGRGRGLELLGDVGAGLVVPVVRLVVAIERVEGRIELVERLLLDDRGARRRRRPPSPSRRSWPLFPPPPQPVAREALRSATRTNPVVHGRSHGSPYFFFFLGAAAAAGFLPESLLELSLESTTSDLLGGGAGLDGVPELATDDEGRRLVVETAVGQRGRPADLVDHVVFGLVVLREPLLAVARVLVEVLVLHRVVEAALERGLGELLLVGRRRVVDARR